MVVFFIEVNFKLLPYMKIQPLDRWLPHKDRTEPPLLVVLHATAGAAARSSIDHLRSVGLSYHYILARDGKDALSYAKSNGSDPIIFQCVPDDKEAFHVASTIPAPGRHYSINRSSIGINLANRQTSPKAEPYPDQQIEHLVELLKLLKKRHESLLYITTHALVQPWNKSDPRNIDLAKIAQLAGLEVWKPLNADIGVHRPMRTKL